MKILSHQITAATDSGTTWWKITRDDILKNSLWKDNVWFRALIEDKPLSQVLDLDSLDGSFATDDTLYLMDSDYVPIIVHGEEIDPDEVASLYDIDDISEYIDNNPDSSILRKLTDSDIRWSSINIEEFAKMLLDYNDLRTVAVDAEDVGLIEF